jgi:glycerophosphoryl diester phosphodiesterase
VGRPSRRDTPLRPRPAARGIPVHVWTVDDEDMHRLLDWGVEGLITDRPDVLGRVLHERVGTTLPSGTRGRPADT